MDRTKDSTARHLLLFSAILLVGCVGTDYLADPPVTMPPRVEVSPDMVAVEVGSSTVLAAVLFDEQGKRVPEARFAWTSADTGIAAVGADGVVRGLKVGQTRITAVAGTTSSSALVGVVAGMDQVAVVRLTPGSGELRPGETLRFSATSFDLGGGQLPNRVYTWHSSAPEIVRTDSSGVATALTPGSAAVQAEDEGVFSNPARLEVLGATRGGRFIPRPGSPYQCQGAAVLRSLEEGGLTLEFGEDFAVDSGPRLEVFLSSTNAIGPGSISLGELKQTAGFQAYAVPSGVELNTFGWVIIHCVPFNVTFGYAQLE